MILGLVIEIETNAATPHRDGFLNGARSIVLNCCWVIKTIEKTASVVKPIAYGKALSMMA